MLRPLVVLALAAALAAPSFAEETRRPPENAGTKEAPAKTEDRSRPASDDAPVVIDNDALEARYGDAASPVSAVSGTPPSAPAPEAEPLPEALQAIEDEKARDRTRTIALAQLDAEIAGLEARIGELEKRILAVRNPFLPRPVIPADQEVEWSRLTAPQRVERTQAEIDAVRRDLDAARGRRERLAATP